MSRYLLFKPSLKIVGLDSLADNSAIFILIAYLWSWCRLQTASLSIIGLSLHIGIDEDSTRHIDRAAEQSLRYTVYITGK